MSLPLSQTRAGMVLKQFWNARQPRERVTLTIGAAVILLALIHSLMVAPALNGRIKLDKELPELRQQLAQLQAMTRETVSLAAKPAATFPAISRENIEVSLRQSGITPQNLALSRDMVQLKLSAASFSGLLLWLEAVQRDLLLVVTEANIVVLPQPDRVDATLSLHQTVKD